MFDFAKLAEGGAVPNTPDLRRVRDLEWFVWQDHIEGLVDEMHRRLRKPGSTAELRPIQAAGLASVWEMKGGFNPMRTGAGKGLFSLLIATLLDAKRPLLLLPAAREVPTREIIREWGHHFYIRNHFILSYEMLSQQKYGQGEDGTSPLVNLKPDLIIADEAHMLQDSGGTRWKRLKRLDKTSSGHWIPHEDRAPFVCMSGSFSSRSGKEYWHLIKRALNVSAPVPMDWQAAQEWWRALDSKTPVPMQPGALLDLAPSAPGDGEGFDAARARYGRRLVNTRGVVSSGHDVPDIELTCEVVTLEPSAEMAEAAKKMRATWELPCGLPFETAMELWRHERELSCGLYQKWRVPGPTEWLMARKGWSKWLRVFLAGSSTYETPKQVEAALDLGRLVDAEGSYLLAQWREIEPSFEPATEAVWLCDSTLRFAANWVDTHKGIVWVHHREFGAVLSRETKLPYFREAGCDPDTGKHIERHRGPCIASIQSCSTGHNLQHQRHNLVVTCPTKNSALEQLISRTHRDGQKKPVHVTFLQRLEGDVKALAQARADCAMVERTFQAPQRMSLAKWT